MIIPRALAIAGSDSGGGAGIQADIKTFTAFKVYGLSVITSVTAQNTVGVKSIYDLPVEIIEDQIDAVMEDIGCDAVKIGMLSNSEIIACVSRKLEHFSIKKAVLDTVMVSKSGSRLLREDAVSALVDRLVPISYVVTPNIEEAEILANMKIDNTDDMRKAAEKILGFGCGNVIIKGGHLVDKKNAVDILYDGAEFYEFNHKRIETKNTHGTGCTFSSAICAGLALGENLYDSVKHAKAFTTNAIKYSLDLGRGYGPLMHYWNIP